ncbi:MAG: hypothetical protein TRG1_315 [Flavobacteriaceae bacterium FS1-H7996/R]|nr:MAG: hypothetical protein TRG1_315 [Flavobacteriaceae bacterium FS1-H7996/R]
MVSEKMNSKFFFIQLFLVLNEFNRNFLQSKSVLFFLQKIF